QPHVLAARARGLGSGAILLRHVVPLAAPPLLALLGVSFAISFGAAIPIEALCDSPGLGQLAWHAALSRDLPLIVNVTLIVALVMLVANSLAAVFGSAAGLLGGWFERIVLAATDLSLALPWLFLLLVVRAMLPLDVPPLVSVVIAFLMMGLLGWQASVRVICAAARGVRDSDFLLLARSSGCRPARLLVRLV